MAIDLEEEQDPPCFKTARKKKLQQLEDQGKAEEVVEEISQLQTQIEKFLSDRKKKLNKPSTKYSQFTPQEENAVAEQFAVEETIESINAFVSDGAEDILLPERGPGPTAASLGLKESIEECMRVTEGEEPVETGGELDLTGIDDKELEAYIMTSEEVKVKTHLWMEVHAEFLEQQKEKQLQKAREEEENAKKTGQPKRKKRQFRKKNSSQAHTAGEAIEKMLLEKKLSCKINYDVLKNLNTPNADPPKAESEVVLQEALPAVAATGRLTRVASAPKNSGAPPRSISGLMSTILSNHRRKNIEKENEKVNESPEKVMEVVDEAGSSAEKEEIDETVLQQQDADLEQEMEEEEVEEDDGHLSVAQLLGHHRGEEEMEYYEEEEEQEDYDDYR